MTSALGTTRQPLHDEFDFETTLSEDVVLTPGLLEQRIRPGNDKFIRLLANPGEEARDHRRERDVVVADERKSGGMRVPCVADAASETDRSVIVRFDTTQARVCRAANARHLDRGEVPVVAHGFNIGDETVIVFPALTSRCWCRNH